MTDTSHLSAWSSRNILLLITCCYMVGATGADHISQISPTLLLVVPALTLSAGYILLHKILGPGRYFLLIFFLVIGFIHTRQALQPPKDPSHIYNRITEKTVVTLGGTVTGLVTHGDDKSRFVLQTDTMIRREQPGTGKIQPTTGKVQLAVRGQDPLPLVSGQRVLVVATVDRIKNYQTPGTFDYVLYMRNQGIYSSGWIRSIRFIQPLPPQSGTPWADIISQPQKVRQQISRFLQSRSDPIAGGLYQALLIGNRSELSPGILEQFSLTGCMHLLAISGLHMGLLALLIYGLLNWIMKRSQWLLLHTHVPTLALALSFPVLFLYAFIAGMNIPVLRSLIMAAILLAAVLVRREHSILHLVAAAALLTLALHPLSLFTVSFQLSFTAVLAIALVYPRLRMLCFRGPEKQKESRTSPLIRLPLAALLVSCAATAGTLPLLLYHFNRFSPIGPFMNLLIEPLLCFVALPLGLIAVPIISLSPDLAAALIHLGGIALHAADALTRWAGRIPFASIWTITPSILEILFYYALLLAALLSGHRRVNQHGWTNDFRDTVTTMTPLRCYENSPKRNIFMECFRIKTILLAVFSALLLLHFISGPQLFTPGKTAEVSYLDVGQGTASLLELPDGTTVLIDGGGGFSRRFNVGKNIIAPFLWKKRIRQVDMVVITHPDSDHYNGLEFIIRRFHPEIVYTNGQPSPSSRYNALLTLTAQTNIQERQATGGDILHSDSLCRLFCIGMPGLPMVADSDNDSSLVLKLQCGDRSFLFPGDIEEQAESVLIRTKQSLRADVLLAPHHGSNTSSSRSFIEAVHPGLIVVSAGRTRQRLFPATVHQTWWKHKNIPFLITGKDGTISCITDGKNLVIQH